MSADGDRLLRWDRFETEVRPGRVVGSRSSSGDERLGLDPTRSLGVDHGALRVTSLRRAGWGTAALGYPPVTLAPGDAFGAFVLNGHNTSQSEPLGEPLRSRLDRWLRGNEVETRSRRALAWIRHGRTRWTLRRFAHWTRLALAERRGTLLLLDENLAVGFYPELDDDPLRRGSGFVMHATGHDNGELWAVSDGRARPVLSGVRNVPLYLLAVCDDDDVVFFGASVDGVRSLPALPAARPLAVLPRGAVRRGHPAVLQSVSGQIGFAADTRVWETLVGQVPGWLRGAGGPAAGVGAGSGGGPWPVPGGVGLLRVTAGCEGSLEVGFRIGPDGAWRLVRHEDRWSLRRVVDGVAEVVAEGEAPGAVGPTTGHQDVQITDDGCRIGVTLDGALLFGRWIDDGRDGDADGCDVDADPGVVRTVAAYPRRVELPEPLRPTTVAVRPAAGLVERVVDDFDGGHGDLAGRPLGAHRWERTTGTGRFVLTGSGARVEATAARPLDGRVVYTVPSPSPEHVELEIDVLPPGAARGEGERGRAGVVFEQDDGDSLIVSTWLDDVYAGASISSFFRLDGFEDLYDAIWSNVGRGVSWGEPYRLRVAFDGLVYEAYLDDELVIHRSLADVSPDQRRLRIDRIGIVANWEWGTDTGSVFRRVTVRTPPPGGS